MFVELDDHQLKAIDKLDNGKILWGGVGTGKSRTALGYFWKDVLGGDFSDRGSHSNHCDLYIITTAKKRDSLDWNQEAARFGIVRDRESSVNHTGLVVDSWNNLGKYEDVEDAFFIFDEQRVVGSGRWSKQFIKIAKANRWILLTATPGDTWLDYIPVFVANGFYKNRTEFKREHVVYNTFSKFPKVERYIGTGRLVRHRNSLLVHMPYKRNTIRIEHDVEVDYDRELFKKVMEERWHVYEDRPLRDVAELFSVMRKVVNSDRSRLQAVKQLTTQHKKLIVFYNFDYELEILRTLVPEGQLASDASIRDLKQKLDTSPRSPSKNSRTTSGSGSQTGSGSGSLDGTAPSSKPRIRSVTSGLSTTQPQSTKPSSSISTTGTGGSEWISRNVETNPQPSDESGAKTSCEASSETKSSKRTQDETPKSTSERPTGTPKNSFAVGEKESEEWQTHSYSSSTPNKSKSSDTLSRPGSLETASESTHEEPLKNGASFSVAEWNGHKHEPIPETDSWVYLVQYQAGAEGWNCTSTDAICFYSQTYSYKLHHQAMGRIDRLNTLYKYLYYYRLLTPSYIDKAIQKALDNKQSFNESAANVHFVPLSESSADVRV